MDPLPVYYGLGKGIILIQNWVINGYKINYVPYILYELYSLSMTVSVSAISTFVHDSVMSEV